MRILHINAGNLSSGAGMGALNVHLSLLENNVESKILCQTPLDNQVPQGFYYSNSLLKKLRRIVATHFERVHLLYFRRKSRNLFSSSLVGIDLANHPLVIWADIIHLHWINQGFVSLDFFTKVNKPIVWTLRDMWPFTGGCHQSFDCDKYKSGCGNCPVLDSSCSLDLSRFIYNAKLKKLRNFQAIGISDWITKVALSSKLFVENGIDCYTINNIVSVEQFKYIPLKENSLVSQVDSGKRFLLIGALDVSSDYKGYKFIRQLFSQMDPSKYHWLSFGDYDISQDFPSGQTNYTHYGFLSGAESLSMVYSLADIFVSTSIAESFGKTIIEAQACGTPVVCFDMCGPSDLVLHKITGYKVNPLDVKDLVNGIEWVLENNLKQENMKSIIQFSKEFSKEKNSKEYIQLYKKLLNDR